MAAAQSATQEEQKEKPALSAEKRPTMTEAKPAPTEEDEVAERYDDELVANIDSFL